MPLLDIERSRAAVIAGEAAIFANHPVAGDDHRQRIAADGTRHRAGGVHIADGAGDVLITARFAAGNFPQRLPDAHLKRRANQTQRQVKTAPLAGEKRGQLRRSFRQQRRRLLL